MFIIRKDFTFYCRRNAACKFAIPLSNSHLLFFFTNEALAKASLPPNLLQASDIAEQRGLGGS